MFNNSFTNLRSFYRLESSSWFDSGYIGDWLFATLLWFIGEAIDHSDVFERDFRLDDPLISHPHTKQQIGGHTNNLIAIFVPLLCVLYVSLRRKSYIDFHHGALGLWVSRSLTHLITEFLKNRVGRLRPDFLARCKWREAVQQCTGKAGDIIDGRRSFPSGHSSTVFSGMFFLFLWFSARSTAWSFSYPLPAKKLPLVSSRLGRILLTLAPLVYATWVAVSRVEDYRHHKEDVIVGSLIGIFCATIGYLSYWPNPFSHELHLQAAASSPKLVYRDRNAEELVNREAAQEGYELAQLEEGRT